MTKPKKKTKQEVAAKKQKFLHDMFGDDYANKTPADFIRQAWRDMNRRGRFYDEGASDGDRARVREFAKNKAMEIAGKIQNGDDGGYAYKGKSKTAQKAAGMLAEWGISVAHVGHITELQNAVNKKKAYGDALAGGKLKFGRAQKLLNMYLKYMWCADVKIPVLPPHCPFDGKIINLKLRRNNADFWNLLGGRRHVEKQPEHENIWTRTQSDSVEDYLVWLAAAEYVRIEKEQGVCCSASVWELFAYEGL